jgi:hypothetical protein
MLVIRDAQMAALGLPGVNRYIEKTIRDIRALFPQDPRFLDDERVRDLIRAGIAAAKRYGIDGNREVSLFLFLICEFGADFDTQKDKAWMRDLLSAGNLDERAKMDLIYEKLRILSAAAEAGNGSR